MKIQNINLYNIKNSQNFCSATNPPRYKETVGADSFVKNLSLNAAIDTMREFDDLSILPAGSWITGKNYDPKLSDHDLTFLFPSNYTYPQMEARVFDAKECLKQNVTKRLKNNGISEKQMQEEILPMINVFPPPQMKYCFDSYNQYRATTNLKISLHDNVDYDKGLWQMKGLIFKHFLNEGSVISKNDSNQIVTMPIKNNEPTFKDILKKQKIYMAQDQTMYSSDKLKIISEFIEKLNAKEGITKKEYYKLMLRIKKFLLEKTDSDLFLVSEDARKINNPKFAKRIKAETQYKKLLDELTQEFVKIKNLDTNEMPEKSIQISLKKLIKFKNLAEEILSYPSLTTFRNVT